MSFDYIVVGAGSAGCVLANRLSANPDCRVLLVEAGGEPDTVLATIPGAAIRLWGTKLDWAFTTVPQANLFGRRIAYPRGRAVGGTSVLNMMMYVRGNRGDYDRWRSLGNVGWGYDDVLPYFRRSEANATFDDAYHGTDGPMSVVTTVHSHPLCEYFLEAAQSLGVPRNPDFNGAVQEGCGYFQATVRDGRRCGAKEAFIDPIRHRPNLTLLPDALVLRLVIDRGRARGVEYLAAGRVERAEADGEVICAAGAIGSPHLMMLSGLGPAAHLAEHGIAVVADLPGVGQDLQDHMGGCPVSATLQEPGALRHPGARLRGRSGGVRGHRARAARDAPPRCRRLPAARSGRSRSGLRGPLHAGGGRVLPHRRHARAHALPSRRLSPAAAEPGNRDARLGQPARPAADRPELLCRPRRPCAGRRVPRGAAWRSSTRSRSTT